MEPIPTTTPRHVINFSGGAGSFFTALRVIERHGPEGVCLLFADTLTEDDDLYRFITEARARLDVPLYTLTTGENIWQLFKRHKMIGNSGVALCSRVLKHQPLWAWMQTHCNPTQATIYFGMDWTEPHRLEALRKRHPEWKIECPLMDKPRWDKSTQCIQLAALGIQPPRLYRMGFPHNNCGGFCVKAGLAQFAHMLKTMPDRYAYHEEQERQTRALIGKDVAVLRDRRGGKSTPMTLETFRHRLETGDYYDPRDWGGCGCATVL
jgi:hypothetical protein